MWTTSSLRRCIGSALIALAASAAVVTAPASAQSAYGCGRIDTRIELAESAAGPDVYTALPRSRSTFVARFIATPVSTGAQAPKPGICVFSLRLTGLTFVTGAALPPGVVLAAGGASATWTLNFVAGQSPRLNLPVRAKSAKTKAAQLAIRAKTSADPITAFTTSLKAARALRARGALSLDALKGALRENRRRTFAGTIDVPRCTAADAGRLRLHFTLPNGLRGSYPQAVDVARVDAVVVEAMVGDDVDDLEHPHERDHRRDEQQGVRAVGAEAVGHTPNATGAYGCARPMADLATDAPRGAYWERRPLGRLADVHGRGRGDALGRARPPRVSRRARAGGAWCCARPWSCGPGRPATRRRTGAPP
jgi:hypothetical protein